MKDNKSVDKILRILELISKYPEGLTLSEIYKKLDLPKSTVFDFLQSLYKADAIYYKDEVAKKYVIGSKMYAIGQAYQKNSSLIMICKPYLKRLCDVYSKLGIVAKRVDNNIVYVYKYASDNVKVIAPEVGSSISRYHSTSTGKCYLAFEHGCRESINLTDLDLITPYTTVNLEELEAELEISKEKGYTTDVREEDISTESFSVPIYNFENRVCGVMTIADVYQENVINLELIKDMKKAAKEISYKLGYRHYI